MTDLLTTLLQTLDEKTATYTELDNYYAGTQPLSFLSPEAKTALGTRFGRMASNLPRLAVTALSERLRVNGFHGADVWREWVACDLDQTSGIAHREALALGKAYVIVWANPPLRARVTLVSGTMALTLAALAAIPGPDVLLIGVSILAGAARGLFTLVGATLVTDVWGPERYAAINGTLTAPMAAAVAIGPFLGAWIAQAAGGYGPTFFVLAGLAGLGALLFAHAVGQPSAARDRAARAAQSA